MAYKLKVVAGSHVQNNQTYKKGQTFEADTNLAEKFQGKFQLLSETKQAAAEVEDQEEPAPAQQPAPEPKLAPKPAPAQNEEEDEFKEVIAKPGRKNKRTRF